LNPALDVSQYAHTPWRISDGFAKGYIYSIAQTPDGYLWLGTEFGLLRFDGVRTLPPPDPNFPTARINRLLAASDGTLWIASAKGLASWKAGKLVQYPEFAGLAVSSLLEDHEGTIWAGGSGRLCAIRKGTIQCDGEDGRLGRALLSLYEYKGSFWVATSGLWRWQPGPLKFYPVPGPAPVIYDLIEGDNGVLWLAMSGGVRQLVNGKVETSPVAAAGPSTPYRLLRDREGGLWIGTQGGGLLHVHQGRTDIFTSADGLSGDRVYGLFEDREGSIWAATDGGLDRFRDIAVATISVKQGLSSAAVGSVLAARDGSVWIGSDGANQWDHGQITIYRKRNSSPRLAQQRNAREINDDGLPDGGVQSLFQDSRGRIWVSTPRGVAYFEDGRFVSVGAVPSTAVHAMAEESAGSLWISDRNLGLFHLMDGRLVEQIRWTKLGQKEPVFAALVPDRVPGGLWLGFFQGGVAYFKDGQIRASYAADDGLGQGAVNDLRLDRGGTLWAATEGGLSRLKSGRIATLTSKNGLPCDAVHWSIEDDAGSVWLTTPCGLVRLASAELEAWAADATRTIKAEVFDSSDGVRNFAAAGGYSPRVAKSADGKLWFSVFDGVSVVDPRHLPFNALPPPVQIEQITADRKIYGVDAKLRLPPLVRELQIDYTALSFVAPEKVRFRYKLEGHDSEWTDAGTRRQAFYNDLRPRNYRFRVMASNNSGVWNEAGASFDFSVDPKYYQTRWFQASCVVASLAVLAGLYRLRVKYLEKRLRIRMEERVNERTRIARDLHDTLLQSFQGTLLRLHAVGYLLPEDSKARTQLDDVVEQARGAITEGRDAIQGLRSSATVTNDLAQAIGKTGQELAADPNAPEFDLQVEGASRELDPIVRDEAYRIACEALRNAFLHAEAKRIEVEIHYDPRRLRLRVRDNGKGIDPKVLSEGGRAGHHGLPGMHERAKLAGGKLTVWSELNSGAEIELIIPASVAYAKSPDPSMSSKEGT
jgi:signal transduction histidine kinase/ligand-binding sensor domain-containing protein